MNDRIYRSREERLFLGVLGGFAVRFAIDPSILRVAYAIVTLLTGIFPLVIVYFVMAIVIPQSPPGWEAAMRAAGPAAAPPPDWMRPPEPGGPPPAPPHPPAAAIDVSATGTADPTAAGGWAAPAGGPAGAPAPAAPASGPAWGAVSASGATVDASIAHANDARTGAIVGGLVLVGLGGAFLLAQVAPQVDWGTVGPVLLVILGIVLIAASFRRA